jgi:hypothetical protein
MGRPRMAEPTKTCAYCGAPMERVRYNGRLEDLGRFRRRRYCGLTCMGLAKMTAEPTLAALRSRARKFRGMVCEACKTTENVQVHHLDNDPSNNAPGNLMTLCGSCHTKWHWRHGKTIPKRRSPAA